MGEETVNNIVNELSSGKTVVIDTSSLSNEEELLVGSVIAGQLLYKHKAEQRSGKLKQLPTINIVLEEAPRVLNSDGNYIVIIYAKIAQRRT